MLRKRKLGIYASYMKEASLPTDLKHGPKFVVEKGVIATGATLLAASLIAFPPE